MKKIFETEHLEVFSGNLATITGQTGWRRLYVGIFSDEGEIARQAITCLVAEFLDPAREENRGAGYVEWLETSSNLDADDGQLLRDEFMTALMEREHLLEPGELVEDEDGERYVDTADLPFHRLHSRLDHQLA